MGASLAFLNQPPPAKSGRTTLLFCGGLALALLGSAFAVDPFAQGGFDAPKRFAALLGASLAAAALGWHASWPLWRAWSRAGRVVAALGAFVFAGLLASGLCATPVPYDELRTLALYALFVPLGAARLLDGRPGLVLAGLAAAGAAGNALLSLLQAVGLAGTLPLAQLGGRYPTGALLGNEAYVALGCALLGAAGAALGLVAPTARARWLGWLAVSLSVAAILANRQLTSAIALLAAIATLVTVRWHVLRWLPRAGAVLALLLSVCAAVPALRAQTWTRVPVSVETWQQLTTYRLGAWAAAVEMIATKPWTGYGPGSYAKQSQVQRFAAEIELRRRLPPPPPATAFVQAHQEYLQVAAEAGLPVLLAVLAALGGLLGGLLHLARPVNAAHTRLEAHLMLGIIVAGAVAALAWFPLQIPFTAIVLLLACGRAWRLLATVPADVA